METPPTRETGTKTKTAEQRRKIHKSSVKSEMNRSMMIKMNANANPKLDWNLKAMRKTKTMQTQMN